MIKGFKHKGLKKLYETGSRHGVNPEHVKRLRMILARLDASLTPQDMNLPGLGLHLLKGKYDYVRPTPPWRNNSRAVY